MSLKAKAVSGAVSTGTGQVLKFAIRTVSLVVLARYLGPADYGVVALVTAITSVLRVFQDAGLSMATVQAPTVSQVASSSMYWLNVLLGTVVAIVICAIGPLAASFYDRSELVFLFPCFALIALVTSFRAQRVALLQRELKFRVLARAEVVSSVLGVAAGIACAVTGWGLWSLVVIEVVQATVNNALIVRAHDWKPDRVYTHAEVVPFLRFGASILASNTLTHSSRSLDAVVIGSFVGPAALGIYNRAQNLLNGPLRQFISPMAAVARAAVFRATAVQDRFTRGVTAILSLIALGSALIVLTSFALAQQIVLVLLGNDWAACIPVFMILMPFAFIEPCIVFLHSVLVSKGEASALLKWKCFSLTVVVAGLFSGIPWGLTGVASAYVLSGVLIRFPLLFWYTSRKVGIPLRHLFSPVLPVLFACVVAGSLALYRHVNIPEPTVLQSLVTLAMTLPAFVVLVMLHPASRASARFVITSIRERLGPALPFGLSTAKR